MSGLNVKIMNPVKTFFVIICFLFLLIICNHCQAQVIVNGKNLNNNEDLDYIQLMYYIDKSSIRPVFYVDYGLIEPDYNDIVAPEVLGTQKIIIDGDELTDRVTVVWVLNKMSKAGWEYVGDVVYIPLRAMNNWHVYTLKRRKSRESMVQNG